MYLYFVSGFFYSEKKKEAFWIAKPSVFIPHFKFSNNSHTLMDLGVNSMLPEDTPELWI
jgi:hypothetical protein